MDLFLSPVSNAPSSCQYCAARLRKCDTCQQKKQPSIIISNASSGPSPLHCQERCVFCKTGSSISHWKSSCMVPEFRHFIALLLPHLSLRVRGSKYFTKWHLLTNLYSNLLLKSPRFVSLFKGHFRSVEPLLPFCKLLYTDVRRLKTNSGEIVLLWNVFVAKEAVGGNLASGNIANFCFWASSAFRGTAVDGDINFQHFVLEGGIYCWKPDSVCQKEKCHQNCFPIT